MARGLQCAKAVLGQFVRADVPPYESLGSCFRHEVREDAAQPAFSICHLRPSVHKAADVGGGVLRTAEADRRVGAHDSDEPGIHRVGAAAQRLESLEVRFDMLGMVRNEDRFHVGEVLVEGGPADTSGRRHLGHGQGEGAVLLGQSPRGLHDGIADRTTVTVDGLLPQLRHPRIIRLVGYQTLRYGAIQFVLLQLDRPTSPKESKMTGNAPDPTDDQAPDRPPRLPLWVKLLGVGVVVAVIVVVLVMVLAGGEHGPGQHGG